MCKQEKNMSNGVDATEYIHSTNKLTHFPIMTSRDENAWSYNPLEMPSPPSGVQKFHQLSISNTFQRILKLIIFTQKEPHWIKWIHWRFSFPLTTSSFARIWLNKTFYSPLTYIFWPRAPMARTGSHGDDISYSGGIPIWHKIFPCSVSRIWTSPQRVIVSICK